MKLNSDIIFDFTNSARVFNREKTPIDEASISIYLMLFFNFLDRGKKLIQYNIQNFHWTYKYTVLIYEKIFHQKLAGIQTRVSS